MEIVLEVDAGNHHAPFGRAMDYERDYLQRHKKCEGIPLQAHGPYLRTKNIRILHLPQLQEGNVDRMSFPLLNSSLKFCKR